MGYLPKAILLKAYSTLSTLTEDHKQGQTQIVSAVRHLVAFDMFYKKYGEDCDLADVDNRELFVDNVREIVNIEDDIYTTNFYTTLKPLYDCAVGSNFFSAGVVKNSRENTRATYDYPTRGQFPLFQVRNYELIRNTHYYKNLSKYLFNDSLKSAFIIWLLRAKLLEEIKFASIQQSLKRFLTNELVDQLLPKEEKFNAFIEGFGLERNMAKVSEKEIMSIFIEKEQIDYLNPSFRPYITAIKSKPFLLLAGISGTGKSRIVRELARACWNEGSEEFNEQKPRNFEMIQVKPNWHDSSELIGYVSRVSGNPVFVAGDFLKFVSRAWEELDIPYFLCLDEMNLAPVEQYFAEYLSVIESRKADADGNVATDPILKGASEEWYWNLCCQLTSDEELRVQFRDEGISIPQNLIVIGTVNMDETTFSFSRKVLDRAMTIEMNEVNLKSGLTSKYEHIGKLGAAELIGNAVEGVDIYSSNKAVCDTAIEYLQSINEKLEGTPFKIAYRTRNEVLLYVVNNLPYNQIEGDDEHIYLEQYVIARALDEITNMKILSRIEGDEAKVNVSFLDELGKIIKDKLEAISDCSFDITETDESYKSVSLAKLQEMKDRLKSGYTSFWS